MSYRVRRSVNLDYVWRCLVGCSLVELYQSCRGAYCLCLQKLIMLMIEAEITPETLLEFYTSSPLLLLHGVQRVTALLT